MKSSERFEFHFKPKSFIICPVLTLYLLSLPVTHKLILLWFHQQSLCVPAWAQSQTRPDESEKLKRVYLLPSARHGQPFSCAGIPVVRLIIWTCHEIFCPNFCWSHNPFLCEWHCQREKALCLTNDCCTKHQTMLRLWGKAKEEEVNSEKGSTPFDLIPCDWRREGRDVSEPLRRPNPNALIEVVF